MSDNGQPTRSTVAGGTNDGQHRASGRAGGDTGQPTRSVPGADIGQKSGGEQAMSVPAGPRDDIDD